MSISTPIEIPKVHTSRSTGNQVSRDRFKQNRIGPSEVGLLLGSNIQPEFFLPSAVNSLGEQIDIKLVSSVWETPAIGSNGPNFLSAAVLASTSLSPKHLKRHILQPLEAHLGRVRSNDKNAPRTIDIDIVTWNMYSIDDDLWKFNSANKGAK